MPDGLYIVKEIVVFLINPGVSSRVYLFPRERVPELLIQDKGSITL